MKFYEILEKHYDEVFPFQKDTYNFIKEGLTLGDKVLDVACGTGSYTIQLKKDGYNACGLDLSLPMIQRAEEKAREEGVQVDFVVSSMLDIDLVHEGNLRRLFIIGNSLVHLKSLQEVRDFFTSAYDLLSPEGDLMIQILNYDRILSQDIQRLPTIEVPEKGLVFQRLYRHDVESNTIEFSSQIKTQETLEEASVFLLPLKKEDLQDALMHSGFQEIHFYGSFTKEPYTEEAIPLIMVAKKKIT